jgi:Domain of unknown function (DUF4062)
MTEIRTPDQRLRVFVSSTMNELADARLAARRAVEQLHLTPVMFELGARPYPPRDLYVYVQLPAPHREARLAEMLKRVAAAASPTARSRTPTNWSGSSGRASRCCSASASAPLTMARSRPARLTPPPEQATTCECWVGRTSSSGAGTS